MKKFLFTLLTLFMASSAFAGDYFYIDDITLTKEEAAAGCKKIAYVKAHFDNAVSAWQVDLTLPDGVTIDVAQPAADMTITYLGKFTDEETMDVSYAESTYTPDLAHTPDYTRFIVSVFTTVEYDEAGNSYGICYRPGDYDAMWRVRLVIPAGFKGGDLNVHTAPSGPAKPYPGLTTSDKVPSDHVTAIRIKADTPEIAVDGDQYKKTVTITAEEGATIYYSTDGESYTVYNEPVVFDKAGTYTVYAYAEGPGEEPEKKSKSDVATSEQFTIVEQALPQFDAIVKVNHTGDENNFYLLYRTEGNDPDQNPEVTVTVTVDGTPLTNVEFLQNWTLVQDDTDPDNGYMKAIYNHVKSNQPGEHIVKVELTVAPGPGYVGEPKTASAEWKYTIKNKFQGQIVFGDVDPTTGKMKVSYEGPETDYTMSISLNGQDADVDENGMIQLEEGANKIFVTVSKAGYDMLQAEANPTWTKPAPQDLQGQIVFGDVDEETGLMPVSYNGNENVTLAVTVKDAQGNEVPATFENGVVTLPEYGTYTVEVVASADGYNDKEANKEVTWTKPTPKELTGEITFSVTQGNKNNEAAGIVTATYNGPETGVTVKIVGDPTKVAAATSEGVRLPDYGTYQVKAIATAEGYADLDGEGEVTWEEPQTAAPEFNVSEDGLTVEATGEGTVTLYIVNADGSETALDNPTTFDQKEEAYTVNLKAVAHVDGAKDGVATKTITIPAKSTEPGTGVNELVDGKAVKSVRYFNMAGQEMQEVNGVTIVVTTYTDGTTSAVKVMK